MGKLTNGIMWFLGAIFTFEHVREVIRAFREPEQMTLEDRVKDLESRIGRLEEPWLLKIDTRDAHIHDYAGTSAPVCLKDVKVI